MRVNNKTKNEGRLQPVLKKDSWVVRGLFVAGGIALSTITGLGTLGLPLIAGAKSLIRSWFVDEKEFNLLESFNLSRYGEELGVDFNSWEDVYAFQDEVGVEFFYLTGDEETSITALFLDEELDIIVEGLSIMHSEGLIQTPDLGLGNIEVTDYTEILGDLM